jgi:hypothetical protein
MSLQGPLSDISIQQAIDEGTKCGLGQLPARMIEK